MRTLVVHMQTTLDDRIANADGLCWESFPWGEEEMAWLIRRSRAADTWALGRRTYEAIVPWWDQVAAGEVPDAAPELTAADREFAALLRSMTKVFDAGAVVARYAVAPPWPAVAARPGPGPGWQVGHQ
jgi:dihydrofolate reductase